ncbi:MAG: hypothetical protein O8C66_06330 [Candidatus Methanoperedens sp.]|nr:hypothetical protein [Candidatus Methanoperedens sp.]MCZ7370108.1 hypothetical protein [Candidatus Methanoperedens sp.]
MSKHGTCCICGKQSKLSFEHTPPQKAFNFFRSQEFQALPLLTEGKYFKKGKLKQKGVGNYSLCSSCNNITGHLYGEEYKKWTMILSNNMKRGNLSDNRMFGKPKPIEIILQDVHPLRFFKQVIAIFCSRNGNNFQLAHPDLKDYLLQKDSQNFPFDFSVYMYLTTELILFNSGIVGLWENGGFYLLSEFIHYPFGFCLFIGNVLKLPITDITYFNQYTYNEKTDIHIEIPIINRKIPHPADYRTEYEVSYDAIINQLKFKFPSIKK